MLPPSNGIAQYRHVFSSYIAHWYEPVLYRAVKNKPYSSEPVKIRIASIVYCAVIQRPHPRLQHFILHYALKIIKRSVMIQFAIVLACHSVHLCRINLPCAWDGEALGPDCKSHCNLLLSTSFFLLLRHLHLCHAVRACRKLKVTLIIPFMMAFGTFKFHTRA